MNHLRTSSTSPDGRVGDLAARTHTPQQWWCRLPPGMQTPVWSIILGSLIILGMLLAFHQVVHGAVQQGELRHKANALHAEATWRCKILPGRGASDGCLLQLASQWGDQTVAVVSPDLLSFE